MKSKKSVIGYPIPKDNSYIQRNKFTVLTPEIGVGIDLNKKKNKVSFNQNQPEQSTRAIPHPTELFEDWPTDSEINTYDFFKSGTAEPFADTFFENIDLRLLFNNEIQVVNWRRPLEFTQYNLVLQELLKKKTVSISPKFIIDFVNANPSTRKFYSSKLGTTENNELNNFISENAMTLNRLLKMEYSFFVVDAVMRNEQIKDYETKKDKCFYHTQPKSGSVVSAIIPNPAKDSKQKRTIAAPKIEASIVTPLIDNQTIEILEFLPNSLNNKSWSCNFTIWISSILQFIKDEKLKDVNNNLNLWSKIYPQDADGRPVYNPNGRYWVKLYFFGTVKKIEIDDRMPCTEFEEFILPRCLKLEELWPCIITKALMKLYYFKINQRSYVVDKVGDGSLLYSILGYVPEKIDIETSYSYISKCLPYIYQDNLFTSKHKLALCYNSKQAYDNLKKLDIQKKIIGENLSNSESVPSLFGSAIPSDKVTQISSKPRFTMACNQSSPIKLRSELSIKQSIIKMQSKQSEKNIFQKVIESKIEEEEAESNRTKAIANPIPVNLRELNEINIENKKAQMSIIAMTKRSSMLLPVSRMSSFHYKRSNTFVMGKALVSFAYSICDFFYNFDFNMDRLNSLDFKDINEMSVHSEIPYRQMSKEEKRKYLYDLVALKNRQKDLRHKRIECLAKAGQHKSFIKIGSEAIGLNELNNYGEFKYSNFQLEIAKNCVKFNSKFPPLSFYESLVDGDEDLSDQDDENNPLLKAKNQSDIEALVNNESFAPHIKQRKSVNKGAGMDTPGGTKKSNFVKMIASSSMNKKEENDDKVQNSIRDANTITLKRLGTQPKLMSNSGQSINISKRLSIVPKQALTSGLNIHQLTDSYNVEKAKTKTKIKQIYNLMLVQSGIISTKNNQISEIVNSISKHQFGEWMDFSKFIMIFDKISIINNTSKYPYKTTLNQTLHHKKAKKFEEMKQRLSVIDIKPNKRAMRSTVIPTNDLPIENELEDDKDEIFSLDRNHSVFRLAHCQQSLEFRSNSKQGKELKSVLIMFESSTADIRDLSPIINISIVSQNDPKFCVPYTLKNFFDVYEYDSLQSGEDYFILLDSCFCPSGFFLTLFSDLEITNISYSEYLKTFKSFKSYQKEIEVPAIPKNSYYVLMKFNINLEEKRDANRRATKLSNHRVSNSNIILLKPIIKENDKYDSANNSNDSIHQFLSSNDNKYFNQSQQNDVSPPHKQSSNVEEVVVEESYDEGLVIKFSLGESSNLINEYIDIFISTKQSGSGEESEDDQTNLVKIMNYEMFDIYESCNVCISIKSPSPIRKQTAYFEILGNIKYNADFMNITDSFEIQDKAYLIKNCTVFKEQLNIYSQVYATMNLRFFLTDSEDYHSKDFEKEHFTTLPDYSPSVEDSILFKLEIKDDEKSLMTWRFKNEINITDIFIPYHYSEPIQQSASNDERFNSGVKKKISNLEPAIKVKSYSLVCSVYCVDEAMFFDIKNKLSTSFWTLKIFATAPVMILKDITKFDLESKEINSWKLKESERPSKAKNSRLKFLEDFRAKIHDIKGDKHNMEVFERFITSEYPEVSLVKAKQQEIQSKSNEKAHPRNSLALQAQVPTFSVSPNPVPKETQSHLSRSSSKPYFASTIKGFMKLASHSKEQQEVSKYLQDNSIYKSHMQSSSYGNITNLNVNNSVDSKLLKNCNLSLINESIHLPKIYQPTYVVANKSESTNIRNSASLDYTAIQTEYWKNDKTSPSKCRASLMLSTSKKNVLSEAGPKHIDYVYINETKSRLYQDQDYFEKQLNTDNMQFDDRCKKSKSSISTFYKSFFTKRINGNSNAKKLYSSRSSISITQSECSSKLNLLASLIDKHKGPAVSTLDTQGLTPRKLAMLGLVDIKELIVTYHECYHQNYAYYSVQFRETIETKFEIYSNFIIEACMTLIKHHFDKLNELKQEKEKDNKKDKSKEIKEELRSLAELIKGYDIKINRSYLEAIYNVV